MSERTYSESEMQLERAELQAVIKYECEQKVIAIEEALKLQDEMAERVREAAQTERRTILTALRIMLDEKSGAALNAVVEDYPEIWKLLQEAITRLKKSRGYE